MNYISADLNPNLFVSMAEYSIAPKVEIIWFHLAENPGSSAVHVNGLLSLNSNKKYFFLVYCEKNYGHVCLRIIQCFNPSWISTTISALLEKAYFV